MVASIPASISAIISVISIVVNTVQNRKRAEREALYKNKINSRDKLKNDLASYMGKVQQCYCDTVAAYTPNYKSNFELATEHLSETIKFGYMIKLEINPSVDILLSEKIDEINEICATFDLQKLREIKFQELYNLSYSALAAMEKDIKKLAA